MDEHDDGPGPPDDIEEAASRAGVGAVPAENLDHRLVLEALTDAVVAADEWNRIVYANRAAEALLGWQADELTGRPLTAIMPPRLREAHLAGFSRWVATHESRIMGRPLRVPALRRDGTEVDIELNLGSVRLADGADLVVASLRDLRDRLELE
ncbi:MAG TPA: PAS domain S-box protein, partial [Egibacteraceae bacterium]|nr:PAS domain S-box protein [Egibacteraceae bacterium]